MIIIFDIIGLVIIILEIIFRKKLKKQYNIITIIILVVCIVIIEIFTIAPTSSAEKSFNMKNNIGLFNNSKEYVTCYDSNNKVSFIFGKSDDKVKCIEVIKHSKNSYHYPYNDSLDEKMVVLSNALDNYSRYYQYKKSNCMIIEKTDDINEVKVDDTILTEYIEGYYIFSFDKDINKLFINGAETIVGIV